MWYISVILWTSDARNYVIKLQVLQTMCFRIATLIQVVNSQGCMVFFFHQNTDWMVTYEGEPQIW